MDPIDLSAAFRKSATFSMLEEADLARLVSACRTSAVSEGESIIEQGTHGSELFVILSGTFDVVVGQAGLGISKSLKTLTSGEIVGSLIKRETGDI